MQKIRPQHLAVESFPPTPVLQCLIHLTSVQLNQAHTKKTGLHCIVLLRRKSQTKVHTCLLARLRPPVRRSSSSPSSSSVRPSASVLFCEDPEKEKEKCSDQRRMDGAARWRPLTCRRKSIRRSRLRRRGGDVEAANQEGGEVAGARRELDDRREK